MRSLYRVAWPAILAAVLPSPAHAAGPLRIRFTPVDTLTRRFAELMPWSPVGHRLMLEDNEGLYVYDPTSPPEKQVWPGLGRTTWSPDGSWLLRMIQHPDPTESSDTLVALSADGTRHELVRIPEDAWPFIWGSDGLIYVWG